MEETQMTKTEAKIRELAARDCEYHINNTVQARIALRLCNTDEFTILMTPSEWAMQSYVVVANDKVWKYKEAFYRFVSNDIVRKEWLV
jgi:hypothetical protein